MLLCRDRGVKLPLLALRCALKALKLPLLALRFGLNVLVGSDPDIEDDRVRLELADSAPPPKSL